MKKLFGVLAVLAVMASACFADVKLEYNRSVSLTEDIVGDSYTLTDNYLGKTNTTDIAVWTYKGEELSFEFMLSMYNIWELYEDEGGTYHYEPNFVSSVSAEYDIEVIEALYNAGITTYVQEDATNGDIIISTITDYGMVRVGYQKVYNK